MNEQDLSGQQVNPVQLPVVAKSLEGMELTDKTDYLLMLPDGDRILLRQRSFVSAKLSSYEEEEIGSKFAQSEAPMPLFTEEIMPDQDREAAYQPTLVLSTGPGGNLSPGPGSAPPSSPPTLGFEVPLMVTPVEIEEETGEQPKPFVPKEPEVTEVPEVPEVPEVQEKEPAVAVVEEDKSKETKKPVTTKTTHQETQGRKRKKSILKKIPIKLILIILFIAGLAIAGVLYGPFLYNYSYSKIVEWAKVDLEPKPTTLVTPVTPPKPIPQTPVIKPPPDELPKPNDPIKPPPDVVKPPDPKTPEEIYLNGKKIEVAPEHIESVRTYINQVKEIFETGKSMLKSRGENK
ncbi:MAG: hypothetical protein ABIH42_08105 [Planctomycetota bacterium]